MEGKALSLYSAFPVQEVINLKSIPFYFARFDQFKALTEHSLLITPNISAAEKNLSEGSRKVSLPTPVQNILLETRNPS